MSTKHENMLNKKIRFYTFYNILGEGAFAKVYQVTDQRDNSQCAIKVIPIELMKETPKLNELVKTEVRVLKAIKNDNVIRYVDSFTSSQSVFIATEFCNGGDMEHYLQDKVRLTEDQATIFLKQILNGFKGLHVVGAMHRDFKLANVLLHNGIAKIADLGFAKQLEKKQFANTILGTSLTMAPEVLEEKPYGLEADLWSIGVVYYQLIYGKYPYTGINDLEILRKIKKSRPDFSSVQISKECRNFIDRCLTVNPKQRIKWEQVYEHPLITKDDGRFIYGVKSKISLGGNQKFYQEHRPQYPNIENMMNQTLEEFESGGEIKASNNANQVMNEANMKKERQRNFTTYERLYFNKRNNIMFIFKYICPFTDVLVRFNANHSIALFITSKKAYLDMKTFLFDIKSNHNILKLQKDWGAFTKSPTYAEFINLFQGDLEMIQAQALSYQLDIDIQSKQIEAEANIKKAAAKNWQKLVTETVNQYWYLLAESLSMLKKQEKKEKQTVIRVLQALDFYRENKITDIEQFDKIMEVLDVSEAEAKIKKKLKEALS